MKAVLKYNLPEDALDFKLALRSSDVYSVLWDLDQWLRSNTKYAPDSMPEDEYKAYEDCRKKLYEIMKEADVRLDV